jgi:hypothetical protein
MRSFASSKKSAPTTTAFRLAYQPPQIVARGVNDVPIMVITLSPSAAAADRWNDSPRFTGSLTSFRAELMKVNDVGSDVHRWRAAAGNPRVA